MDGWPFWLKLVVGCPLAVLIVMVGAVIVVTVAGPHRD